MARECVQRAPVVRSFLSFPLALGSSECRITGRMHVNVLLPPYADLL